MNFKMENEVIDEPNQHSFKINFHELFLSLIIGLVIGILTVIIMISFASLIFSGHLSGYVNQGVGFALFGGVVLSTIIALTSSFKGVVAVPQDTTVAVLAIMAASVSTNLIETTPLEIIGITTIALIIITTLLAGVILFVVGFFKLGNLMRFIPYPVVGGFLTGSGLLLVSGSIGVMTGVDFGISRIPQFFEPGLLYMWMPGVLLAVALLFLLRKFKNFFILPALLFGGIALFYLIVFLFKIPISEAMEQGWLLGSLSGGSFWSPINYQDYTRVEWTAVRGQLGNIIAVPILAIISLLLNVSGIELATDQESDINHELRMAGISNILAGLGGSMSGYHALSLSVLGHKIGIKSRLIGLSTAVTCLIALLLGGTIVTFFPMPVLGGLIMFLGLSFLVEWIYDAKPRLPVVDYYTIILVMVVIGAFGFLPGVALGVVVTIISFAIQYSRISVIKNAVSGADYQSNVDRYTEEQLILKNKGNQLQILKLQGYIFFGSSDTLLNQIKDIINSQDLPVKFMVLDFRQVTGIDSSALNSFQKLKRLVEGQKINLVFTNLPASIKKQLEIVNFTGDLSEHLHIFTDLDYAVEWCENEILKQENIIYEEAKFGLRNRLERVVQDNTCIDRLMSYFEKKQLVENNDLITQGHPSSDIYFIDSGKLTVQLRLDDGETIRLRTISTGVVGELGTYLGTPACASIVTEEPCTVYQISEATLRGLEKTDPHAAMAFHQFIAYLLSERLVFTNDNLKSLL